MMLNGLQQKLYDHNRAAADEVAGWIYGLLSSLATEKPGRYGQLEVVIGLANNAVCSVETKDGTKRKLNFKP